MFCLQNYQPLRIDRVVYRFALAQVERQVNVLPNNCKQNITSLSLLVGMTVVYNFKSVVGKASFPNQFEKDRHT